MDVIYSYPKGL